MTRLQLGTSVSLCILSYFMYAFFRSAYLMYEVSEIANFLINVIKE